MKPNRDWKILVSLSGMLCVLIIAANLYFIYRLSQGTAFADLERETDSTLLAQKATVQKINDEFRKKAARLADFETVAPKAVDPSI